MRQYLNLMQKVLEEGKARNDRTGTGTIGIFGYQMRFDLRDGFPLLTTKKLHIRSIIHELLWFLRGETNVKSLQENGVRIWDEWSTLEQTAKFNRPIGELGPIYGHQWRNYGSSLENGLYVKDGYDQIKRLISDIRKTPESRRLIVSGWNPLEVDDVALPPCHTLFQFYVQGKGLSCQLYQRSGDIFLGVPFNIASYALLTMMIAQVTGLEAHEFVHTFGDVHIYKNHIEQSKEQMSRVPGKLPIMKIDSNIKEIDDFKFEHFNLIGYEAQAHIKAKVSI